MNASNNPWSRVDCAARAIRGTVGEFRRVAILNFCSIALAVLRDEVA